jgi:hypothetical protein
VGGKTGRPHEVWQDVLTAAISKSNDNHALHSKSNEECGVFCSGILVSSAPPLGYSRSQDRSSSLWQ